MLHSSCCFLALFLPEFDGTVLVLKSRTGTLVVGCGCIKTRLLGLGCNGARSGLCMRVGTAGDLRVALAAVLSGKMKVKGNWKLT